MFARALQLLCMVGCGRVAFDPVADAYIQDAYTLCSSGDGVCPVGCTGKDMDCATVCGDGICVGNAGELCGNCVADCKTTQPVCGNARCEPGESPDCYADCGPSPWPWSTREANLLTEVNKKRTNGVRCPGQATTRTAPALTLTTSAVTRNAARDWAWEIAHHDYNGGFTGMGGYTCSGATYAEREDQGDFSSALYSQSSMTALQAANTWAQSNVACPLMMSTSYTKGVGGVAEDVNHGFIFLLK